MKYLSDKEKENTTQLIGVRKGRPPFYVSPNGFINLSNATDKIIKERKEAFENYTFEDISKKLFDILIEVHHSKPKNRNNFITKRVKELLSEIKKDPDQYFYLIPTININLLIDQLEIGNVCLLRLTDEKIEELKKDFSDNILFSSRLDEKRGIVVARISNITANTVNNASKKALSSLENALNALRVVHPWSSIGIQGELSDSHREFMYKKETDGTVGTIFETLDTGWMTRSLKIDEKILDWMKTEGGLKYIQKLFSIESPTRFQNSILTSIHWFGEAVKDEKEEDRFVKLVIALESIFITNSGESKAEKISERLAFLRGKDKEERLDIYTKMKGYIKIRNKIVHEGLVGVEHTDLGFLTDYTRHSIIEFCKRSSKYRELKDFLDELDERKFE